MRGKAGRGRKSAPSTATIPVQATSAGAITANQFTGWTHGAGSIFTRNQWGANVKYFETTTDAAIQTSAISRDHEVTFFASIGRVYLRVGDGKAFLFETNIEAGGGWRVAAVSFNAASYYDTEIATLGSGTPSGLNTSSTASDTYTFGVSGVDVYVKWNGVEQWREKQIFQNKPGRVALKCVGASTYGFRSVSVSFSQSAAIYSTPEFDILDVRDFGLKQLTAVGSMTAASTTLTLTSNPGFAIGDKIIVATGGESGGGLYGSRGVGGQWPTLTYANATAMNADTSQVTNKCAGLLDTGIVYAWNGSAWVQFKSNPSYHQKLQPRALRATITNVSGTTLTLDTAAVVSTTSANVYFDNTDLYTSALGGDQTSYSPYVDDLTIEFPAGNFAVASPANVGLLNLTSQTDGWTFRGQGMSQSILFSPPGVTTLRLSIGNVTGGTIQNLGFKSNQRWDGGCIGLVNATTDQPEQGGLATFEWELSPGATASDCRFTNMTHGFNTTGGCLGENLDFVEETGHMEYIGWNCYASDCEAITYRNITMSGPAIFGGFEFFRCDDSTIDGLTSTNARHALNTATNVSYLNCNCTVEEGCADDARSWYFIQGEPLITIATNIGGSGSNVLFDDFTITVEGPIKVSTNYDMRCIVVDGSLSDVTISGNFPTKPNTLGLIDLYAGYDATAIDISSAITGTTISGVRVKGGSATTDISTANATSVVENCVADSISTGGTTSGNITNAAYEAL